MTPFDKAFSFTLKWEGGQVENPNDPGGRTNLGVTQATFDSWRDSQGLPREDVFNITKDEAAQIAKVQYWDIMGLDRVATRDEALAIALFDWGFHSGAQNVIDRVNAAGARTAREVNDLRMEFLTSLSNFNHFGRGWVRRVEDLRKLTDTNDAIAGDEVQSLDVEMIQVFDGGDLFATFHPAAVSVGPTNSGRTKIMVRFK